MEQDARQIGIAGAQTAQGKTSRAGRSKYRAVRVEAYGRVWASKAELRRYEELLALGRMGKIRNLELQPRFPLMSNGQKVADYVADFRYDERYSKVVFRRLDSWTTLGQDADCWRDVVEDVKGMKTPVYILKRKLFQAQYPQILFREVR